MRRSLPSSETVAVLRVVPARSRNRTTICGAVALVAVFGMGRARAAPPDSGKSDTGAAHAAATPPAEPVLAPEAALARATAFYEAGQYAQCVDAFAALLG